MKNTQTINLLPEYNQAYVDRFVEELKQSEFYTGCIWETARADAEYYNDDIDVRILQQAVDHGFLKAEETA